MTERAVLGMRLVGLGRETRFLVGAVRLAVPGELAVLEVVGLEPAARGELVTSEADDHFVVRDQRRAGHGLAVLGEGVLDVPDFLAGLGVERHEEAVERVEEDLAVGVVHATLDHVATGARHGREVAIGLLLVGPDLHRIVGIGKVERLHDVRPSGDEEHHRLAANVDDDGLAFVTTQGAGRL